MTIEAGVVELEAVPNLSGFSSLLTKGLGQSIGGAESFIKQHLGLALTAGAVVAFAEFAKAGVQAYEQHEEVLLKLENTMATMPKLAHANEQAFLDQAHALQELTGVQDETILSADEVLARFNLTKGQIHDLIPLVLDYAAKTGQDATTAAGNLGRALLGNARALKAIGINFHATGDTLTDFNTILGLLQTHVGGMSEEFGKTLPGQINILKANISDLEENFGSVLVPLLTDAARILNDTLGVAFRDVAKFAGTKFGQAMLAAAAGVAALNIAVAIMNSELILSATVALGNASVALQVFIGDLLAGDVAAGTFSAAMASSTVVMGAWGIALGLAALAAYKLVQYLNMDDDKAQEWTATLESGTATLADYRAAVDGLAGAHSGLGAVVNGNQTVEDAYGKAVQQVTEDIHNQNAEIGDGTNLMGDYGGALDDTTNSNMDLHASIAQVLATAEQQGIVLNDNKKAILANEMANGDLAGALRDVSKWTGVTTGKTKVLGDAQTSLTDALGTTRVTLAKVSKASGHLSDEATKAADATLALWSAELQLAGGISAVIQDTHAASVADKKLAQARQHLTRLSKDDSASDERVAAARRAVKDATDAAFQSHIQLDGAVESFIQTEVDNGASLKDAERDYKAVATQAGLTGAEIRRNIQEFNDARDAVNRFNNELNSIPPVVHTELSTTFVGPILPGTPRPDNLPNHAGGGWVGLHGPELSVVGEKGPEYIESNREAMKNHAQDHEVHVTISLDGDAKGLIRAVARDEIDRHDRYRKSLTRMSR